MYVTARIRNTAWKNQGPELQAAIEAEIVAAREGRADWQWAVPTPHGLPWHQEVGENGYTGYMCAYLCDPGMDLIASVPDAELIFQAMNPR